MASECPPQRYHGVHQVLSVPGGTNPAETVNGGQDYDRAYWEIAASRQLYEGHSQLSHGGVLNPDYGRQSPLPVPGSAGGKHWSDRINAQSFLLPFSFSKKGKERRARKKR